MLWNFYPFYLLLKIFSRHYFKLYFILFSSAFWVIATLLQDYKFLNKGDQRSFRCNYIKHEKLIEALASDTKQRNKLGNIKI